MPQIRRSVEIPSIPWLDESGPPPLRLPAGLRAAVAILSFAGLVMGVRALGSQIVGAPGPQLLVGTKTESAMMPTSLSAGRSSENRYRFVWVSVSGYTSQQDQTDADPWTTASGTRARTGTIALSRDLLHSFTPGAPFEFGDSLLVPGMGVYIVEDTMAPRWTQRADIWFVDNQTAQRWGVRDAYVARIGAKNHRITDSIPHRWAGLGEREAIFSYLAPEVAARSPTAVSLHWTDSGSGLGERR